MAFAENFQFTHRPPLPDSVVYLNQTERSLPVALCGKTYALEPGECIVIPGGFQGLFEKRKTPVTFVGCWTEVENEEFPLVNLADLLGEDEPDPDTEPQPLEDTQPATPKAKSKRNGTNRLAKK